MKVVLDNFQAESIITQSYFADLPTSNNPVVFYYPFMVFSQFRFKLLRNEFRPVDVVVGLLLAFLLSFASDWVCGGDDHQLNVSSTNLSATFNFDHVAQRPTDFEKNVSKVQTGSFLAAQLAGIIDQTSWRVSVCRHSVQPALLFSLTNLGIRLQI